ncbi:MAG: hypothetical protein VCA34_16135 [Roseibacillus sp.]
MQPIARVLLHLAFTVHPLQDHLFEMPALPLAQAVGGDLDGSLTHPEFRAITLFSRLCQILAHAFGLTSHTRLMRLRPRASERWLGRPLFSGNHLLIAAPSSPFGTVEASGKVYLIPKDALRGSAR